MSSSRTSILCSVVVAVLSLAAGAAAQHGSFANTKFELGADLPVEESHSPTHAVIAENIDSKTLTAPASNRVPLAPAGASVPSAAPISPTASPPIPAANRISASSPTKPPLPVSVGGDRAVPALATFPPSPPSHRQPPLPLPSFATLASLAPHTPSTSLPPPIIPIVGVRQPHQPAVSLIARPSGFSTPSAPSAPSSRRQSQTHPQRPSDSDSPNSRFPSLLGNQHGNGQWFREEFDLSTCPRTARSMSYALKRKFPTNLLSNGREAVLADLLATQMVDCRKKQRRDHWNSVERYMDSLGDVAPTKQELNECRAGLIQEQISCLNVISYVCQFIQPEFEFRLIPTRMIVQEARLADEGAEKCKKFTAVHDPKKLGGSASIG